MTRSFRDLKRSLGINGEVKWKKTSKACATAYAQLVDFFFNSATARFRVILVDQLSVDHGRFNRGDKELGFYKFYYAMLWRWIEQGNQYLILLDFKQNQGADRYKTLRSTLERKVKGHAWISDLTVIDSKEAPLGQLCDLLTGAVAASWCSEPVGAKKELSDYIAQKAGFNSLKVSTVSPAPCKFNIFKIELTAVKQ